MSGPLRCEFLWVVRVEFWLSVADRLYLCSLAMQRARVHHAISDYVTNEAADVSATFDIEQVKEIVSLLEGHSERPMLNKIFTEALRIMRETPEVRR